MNRMTLKKAAIYNLPLQDRKAELIRLFSQADVDEKQSRRMEENLRKIRGDFD